MSGGPVLTYFHPARIAVSLEVRQHPALCELLQQYESDDEGGIIGEIAAYCNIAMDGQYTREDLDNLYVILYAKLTEKRKIVLH